MFSLFKKRSEIDKLNATYLKLMKEAREISQRNRTAGDAKYAEADDILKKIDALKQQH